MDVLHGLHASLPVATSKSKKLRLNRMNFEEDLTNALADAVLQAAPRKANFERLDAMVAKSKAIQLHLRITENKLITLYDKQAVLLAEIALMRKHNANKVSQSEELRLAVDKSEQLTKCAKVIRRAEISFGGSSAAKYSALFAERDELKNRCEALMLEH